MDLHRPGSAMSHSSRASAAGPPHGSPASLSSVGSSRPSSRTGGPIGSVSRRGGKAGGGGPLPVSRTSPSPPGLDEPPRSPLSPLPRTPALGQGFVGLPPPSSAGAGHHHHHQHQRHHYHQQQQHHQHHHQPQRPSSAAAAAAAAAKALRGREHDAWASASSGGSERGSSTGRHARRGTDQIQQQQQQQQPLSYSSHEERGGSYGPEYGGSGSGGGGYPSSRSSRSSRDPYARGVGGGWPEDEKEDDVGEESSRRSSSRRGLEERERRRRYEEEDVGHGHSRRREYGGGGGGGAGAEDPQRHSDGESGGGGGSLLQRAIGAAPGPYHQQREQHELYQDDPRYDGPAAEDYRRGGGADGGSSGGHHPPKQYGHSSEQYYRDDPPNTHHQQYDSRYRHPSHQDDRERERERRYERYPQEYRRSQLESRGADPYYDERYRRDYRREERRRDAEGSSSSAIRERGGRERELPEHPHRDARVDSRGGADRESYPPASDYRDSHRPQHYDPRYGGNDFGRSRPHSQEPPPEHHRRQHSLDDYPGGGPIDASASSSVFRSRNRNPPAASGTRLDMSPIPATDPNAATPKHRGSGSSGGSSGRTSVGPGGTDRVLGGSAPLRSPAHQQHQQHQQQRSGDANSVFRTRPGRSPAPAPREENDDDDSPQKILLSLRTPTTSFEERDGEGFGGGGGGGREGGGGGGAASAGKFNLDVARPSSRASSGRPSSRSSSRPVQQNFMLRKQPEAPASPEAPPQIKQSHHKMQTSDPLTFEPKRSPQKQGSETGSGNEARPFQPLDGVRPVIAGPPIETAPSFNLFNQSFDSLGEAAHYLNLQTGSGVGDPTFSFGLGLVNSKDDGGDGVSRAPSYLVDGPVHSFLGPTQPFPMARSGSSSRDGPGTSGSPRGGRAAVGDRGHVGSDISTTLMLNMSPVDSFGGGPAVPSEERQKERKKPMTLVLGGDSPLAGGDALQSPGDYDISRQREERARKRSDPGDEASAVYAPAPASGPPSSASSTDQRAASEGSSSPAGPTVSSDQQDEYPDFYRVLRRYHKAFDKCTFLLPGLKDLTLSSSPSQGNMQPKPTSSTVSNSPDRVTSKSDGSGLEEGGDSIPNPETGQETPSPQEEGKSADPISQDIDIARRRVKSAICAFGGNGTGNTNNIRGGAARSRAEASKSIFRVKSSDSSQDAPLSPRSKALIDYKQQLPNRYYENENRLSWEFEESPPVELSDTEEDDDNDNKSHQSDDAATSHGNVSTPCKRPSSSMSNGGDLGPGDTKRSRSSPKLEPDLDISTDSRDKDVSTPLSGVEKDKDTAPGSVDSSGTKMRYRCKLCGRPKQNHTCPYQQSLQRSIGIMVYPAVNAFMAHEPGSLAPALVEMNNFVPSASSSSDGACSTDSSPCRPSPDRPGMPPTSLGPRSSTPGHGPPHVTPDNLRMSVPHQMQSPGVCSSFSGGSVGASPQRTPFRRPGVIVSGPGPGRIHSAHRPGALDNAGSMTRRKYLSPYMMTPRGDEITEAGSSAASDLLFVESIDLKPEQFRIITPRGKLPARASSPSVSSNCIALRPVHNKRAYKYPALPLPYAQRKRLSDNLFTLSKELPKLTDECAMVLREAREKDMWDCAVAELMTQVVVAVYCSDGDSRLEGLKRYLLNLGIAC